MWAGPSRVSPSAGAIAYQIWRNAIDRDKSLERIIPALPDVVYSTREHRAAERAPEGVLHRIPEPSGPGPYVNDRGTLRPLGG